MPIFAANLTMMFTEWDFLDRFDAAAEAGFTAVEYLFPYDHKPEALAERLHRNHLTQALFNLPPGDWAAGDRGLACHPDRFDEVKDGVVRALDYARATGVRRLHLMAGLGDPTDPAANSAYRRAVLEATDLLADEGIALVLEPINSRNMPGYFLSSVDRAAALIHDINRDHLRLQFDIYHCQIIHGDVTTRLRAMMPIIEHVQIASVPSRHEPDSEELNSAFLFSELDRLGYRGFVGCEYNPRAGTRDGLGWLSPYLSSQRRGDRP